MVETFVLAVMELHTVAGLLMHAVYAEETVCAVAVMVAEQLLTGVVSVLALMHVSIARVCQMDGRRWINATFVPGMDSHARAVMASFSVARLWINVESVVETMAVLIVLE